MLDPRDLSILRQFNWPREYDDRFASKPTIYNIAKSLGYSASTVTHRMENLEANGFLKEIRIFPSTSVGEKRFFVTIPSTPTRNSLLLRGITEFNFIEIIHTAITRSRVDNFF